MTATNTQSNDIDWKTIYLGMETFFYEMTYMAQIADTIIEGHLEQ